MQQSANICITHVQVHPYSFSPQKFGVSGTVNNDEVVSRSQVVWLTVKPHAIGRVLREVAPFIKKDHIVVSAAAGVTIKTLEKVMKHLEIQDQ